MEMQLYQLPTDALQGIGVCGVAVPTSFFQLKLLVLMNTDSCGLETIYFIYIYNISIILAPTKVKQ